MGGTDDVLFGTSGIHSPLEPFSPHTNFTGSQCGTSSTYALPREWGHIYPPHVRATPFSKNKNRPTSFIIKFTRNTSHLVLARTFCQSWLGSDVRAMSLSRVRVNSFYSFFILSQQKTKEPYSSQFLALSLLLVLALVTLYLGTRIPAQLPGQINGWITARPFIIIAEEDFNQIECHECL